MHNKFEPTAQEFSLLQYMFQKVALIHDISGVPVNRGFVLTEFLLTGFYCRVCLIFRKMMFEIPRILTRFHGA